MEIIAFVAGAVAASIAWFFVYRNNKSKFAAAVEEYDKLSASVKAKAEEVKDHFDR